MPETIGLWGIQMKFLLLPFLEALLWVLELLPKKPQASQVRETQPEPGLEPEPVSVHDDRLFVPISRNQVEQAREFLGFMETEQRKAQSWSHISLPRHKRDLDLVNQLKREGRL